MTTTGDRPAALTPRRRRMDPPAPPDALAESEQIQLKTVRTDCPEIDALTCHARSSATMLTGRQGERLPGWLDAVRQDDLLSLHTLAAGIDRGRDAVIAASPALELGSCRRPCQPDQDTQAPDVRPCRFCPAPQTCPAVLSVLGGSATGQSRDAWAERMLRCLLACDDDCLRRVDTHCGQPTAWGAA